MQTQNEQTDTGPVEAIVVLARPRKGAIVSMDMSFWNWPAVPKANSVRWFAAVKCGTGYKLSAPQFGGDPYGSGSLFVDAADVIFKKTKSA